MNRSGRVALSIVTGFVVAVIIASAGIVAYTQYDRAERVEDKLASTKTKLATTEVEMANTEATLSDTEGTLATTQKSLTDAQSKLTETKATLDVTVEQRNTLTNQVSTCRYVVRINDRLLAGMLAQSSATGRVMRGKKVAARIAVRRAGAYARAVQRQVRASGYKSLDSLVAACSTPVQTKNGATGK
jgi:septal ring factor EnvC (AmiA/AmiB activator)